MIGREVPNLEDSKRNGRRRLAIRPRRWLLLALVSCAVAPVLAGDEEQSPPNVVFILADDLGIGDVKCYGRDRSKIDTPHLDSLAATGMQFTEARAVASLCVPVRVAIMTGRYPWRFGKPGPGGPWGYLGTQLPLGQHTLGTMLKSVGYHTASGTWVRSCKRRMARTKDSRTSTIRSR